MDAEMWMERVDLVASWARSAGQEPLPPAMTDEQWIAAAQELAGQGAANGQAARSALVWWGRREVVGGYLTRVRALGAAPMDGAGHDLKLLDVFNGPRTVATFREPLAGPGGMTLLGVDFRAGAGQAPTCTLLASGVTTGQCPLGPDFMRARATAVRLAHTVRAVGGEAAEVMAAQVWLLQQWARIQSFETLMSERDRITEYVRRARIRLDHAVDQEDLAGVEQAVRMLEHSTLALVEIESALACFDDNPTTDPAS